LKTLKKKYGLEVSVDHLVLARISHSLETLIYCGNQN